MRTMRFSLRGRATGFASGHGQVFSKIGRGLAFVLLLLGASPLSVAWGETYTQSWKTFPGTYDFQATLSPDAPYIFQITGVPDFAPIIPVFSCATKLWYKSGTPDPLGNWWDLVEQKTWVSSTVQGQINELHVGGVVEFEIFSDIDCTTKVATYRWEVVAPDFYITEINLSSDKVVPGEEVEARICFMNNNPVTADVGTISWWRHLQSAPSSSAWSAGEESFGALPKGSTASIYVTFTAPGAPGPKKFWAMLNSTKSTIESDYENNVKSASYTVLEAGTVKGEAEPAHGGAIQGVGTYAVGETIYLEAWPHYGWGFVQWEDGVKEPRRTITVETGAQSYKAHFQWVGPFCCELGAGNDEILTTKGAFAGYLHAVSSYAIHEEAEIVGSVDLKLTNPNGKLTAKVLLQKGSVSFKSNGWTAQDGDGTYSVRLTARGGEEIDLHARQNFIWGIAKGGAFGPGELNLTGRRNRFAEKGDVEAMEKIKQFQGYYTTAISPDNDFSGQPETIPEGAGYLTIKVRPTGKVAIAGVLADGTKVSRSTQLLECEDNVAMPLLVPLYRKEGSFSGLVQILNRSGERVGNAPGVYSMWRKPGYGGFHKSTSIWGEEYTPKVTLEPLSFLTFAIGAIDSRQYYGGVEALPASDPFYITVKLTGGGNKLTAPRETKPVKFNEGGNVSYMYEGDNPAGVTLSANTRSGIFKGKFKLYYDFLDAQGRFQHKSVIVPYAGIMLMDGEHGEVHSLRGHALFPTTNPQYKANRLKLSLPVRSGHLF